MKIIYCVFCGKPVNRGRMNVCKKCNDSMFSTGKEEKKEGEK